MKATRILLLTSMIALQSLSAAAGEGSSGGVGNGGGAWVCRETQGRHAGKIRWIQTLDLDEGRRIYAQTKIPDGDEPVYRDVTVEKWMDLAESRMFAASPGFFAKYLLWRDVVLRDRRLVHKSEFTSTKDFRITSAPSEDYHCLAGRLSPKPEQLANYNDELGILMINRELWDSPKLPAIERAALLMHEVLYKMFRVHAGHTDSMLTRMRVAYLFSSMDVGTYAELFSLEALKPKGAWTPRIARYAPIREKGFDFAHVIIDRFDERTGELRLHQYDTDEMETDARNRFLCSKVRTPDGHEYDCRMTYSSNRWTRWRRMHKHRLRILNDGTLVWYNTRRGGRVWVTTYLRATEGKEYDFSEPAKRR